MEDTALALGQALREALGDKAGICRFGDAAVPLDETLARAAIDLSGRPYLVHTEPDGMAPLIGSYDTTLTRHFFESVTATAGICLHLDVTGRNPHHIVEAQFKAVARALRAAVAADPRAPGVPSTKGVLVTAHARPKRRGARLRFRELAFGRKSAAAGRSGHRGDRGSGTRRWTRTGWWCRASARSRRAWPGCARCTATG